MNLLLRLNVVLAVAFALAAAQLDSPEDQQRFLKCQ